MLASMCVSSFQNYALPTQTNRTIPPAARATRRREFSLNAWKSAHDKRAGALSMAPTRLPVGNIQMRMTSARPGSRTSAPPLASRMRSSFMPYFLPSVHAVSSACGHTMSTPRVGSVSSP